MTPNNDPFDAVKSFGATEDEVQTLLDYGCDLLEIEDLLYDIPLLRQMVAEITYY